MKSMKIGMLVMMFALLCLGVSVQAETATTYNRIDEVMDWGPATTKLIVDLKADVPQGTVDSESFTVHVARRDQRLEDPFLEEGDRTVVDAYISDANGNPVDTGGFVTLVMEIGPTISLGSAFNYANDPEASQKLADPEAGLSLNAWTQNSYTITQQKAIGEVSDLVATEMAEYKRPLVDRFELAAASYDDEEFGQIELTYAHYRPALDDKKHPFIVWLHGGGEGGTDATIPLSANKACVFASEEVQAYFGGAYILVPQAPTKWMDARKEGSQSSKVKQDADSIFTRALQNLVEDYVTEHPAIDTKRLYVGGLSNGGFMTVRLILDYPDYYAAATPVCEALNDEYVTDEEVQGIVNIPMWFVTSATDSTVIPHVFPLKLYDRLCQLDAPNVYMSYLRRVIDESGLYKQEDGTPHEYSGHWSWIYVYNNDLSQIVDGENITGRMYGESARHNNDLSRLIKGEIVTFMEWLAAQSK